MLKSVFIFSGLRVETNWMVVLLQSTRTSANEAFSAAAFEAMGWKKYMKLFEVDHWFNNCATFRGFNLGVHWVHEYYMTELLKEAQKRSCADAQWHIGVQWRPPHGHTRMQGCHGSCSHLPVWSLSQAPFSLPRKLYLLRSANWWQWERFTASSPQPCNLFIVLWFFVVFLFFFLLAAQEQKMIQWSSVCFIDIAHVFLLC